MTPTREQLELAAKALGYVVDQHLPDGCCYVYPAGSAQNADGEWLTYFIWNPADDQADSDCMACDLEIETQFSPGVAVCFKGYLRKQADHDNTIEGRRAAVRWARFLVAVEIGRMK